MNKNFFPFDDGHSRNVPNEHDFVMSIPLIPPKKAFVLLEEKGYRGQVPGRKALCLSAYRHVRRIKRIYLEHYPREILPPKSNILLMGPTGCGKTFLVELLFKHILKLPTVVVDMTGFSETGYIGEDTRTILTRLLLAAHESPFLASLGIVCLDEFDKLASCQNMTRFDGQGTTKDVSGYGVQRELLKMLEEAHVEIPTDFNNSMYSTKEKLFTGDIGFIACGAFSNFKNSVLAQNSRPRIGFNVANVPLLDDQKVAYLLAEQDANNVENFQHYGFIPELIGRFSRIIPMFPLDRETLKSILIDSVVKKFQIEFLAEGIDLNIEAEVIDSIVEKSFERQTGARGLGALLVQRLEGAAFEHFCGKPGKLTLKKKGDEIITTWKNVHSPKSNNRPESDKP